MNTVVVVRRRSDGKLYPGTWPVPHSEANRVRWLIHELVHGPRHLSIRQAQLVLLEEHGLRRSIGLLHHDLRAYVCGDTCPAAPRPH